MSAVAVVRVGGVGGVGDDSLSPLIFSCNQLIWPEANIKKN
jgi:hypothetical protein